MIYYMPKGDNNTMKIIKMLSLATIMLGLLSGCFFARSTRVEYAMPEIPQGYIGVDAYRAGHPEDYVKFHSCGLYQNLVIKVMFHNPRTMAWEDFGVAHLKSYGDTDTMKHSTHLGGGLKRLRYFAIQFEDGKNHSVSITGEHNDLHIHVGDALE